MQTYEIIQNGQTLRLEALETGGMKIGLVDEGDPQVSTPLVVLSADELSRLHVFLHRVVFKKE